MGPHTVTPLQAPSELWDRIRRGYALPDLQNELVGVHERWYASRPDYIQRMTERSRKYLFHIVEEIERRNMPAELALLPFIESAFNPQAVSTAKAAGMWQFMPATGRDFELKQSVFRDDRRDVLASTRAALDYLQRLHTMFGDWHLALAAYNWGEGNVGRAIARNKRAGLGTGYEDLNMPNETRNYVPKLQAIKNIVGAPGNFNTELPLIENHPYFQEVEITRDIDVSLAARLADVKLEDFRALNPSASRPVILAAGTRRILLPWDNAEVFKRNFQAHNAGQFASWTAWTAPSTMSVAEAARRTGMSETELRAVNSIPPRMLIKAGSALLVARSARMNEDVSSQVADYGRLGLAPETTRRRATIKAGKGETVASIARRYKLSAANVAEWNKVSAGASFQAGQAVVLYLPARDTQSARAGGRKAPAKKAVAAAPGQRKLVAKAP
jgi:membrane-bound lytic murein transglycosylase D